MTAKEYFKRVLEAKRELELIQDQIRTVTDLAVSLGSGFGGSEIKPSGVHSKVESAAIKLADYTTELNVKAGEYISVVREATEVIRRISKPRYRQVLTLRYVNAHSWQTVSDIMGYSEQKSVFKCHGWALKAAQKYINEISGTGD